MDAERSRLEQEKRNARWIADGDPLKAELAEIGKDAFRERYKTARYNQGFSGHLAQVRMMLDELDREDADEQRRRQHEEVVGLAAKSNTIAQQAKFWARLSAWVGLLGLLIALAALFFD